MDERLRFPEALWTGMLAQSWVTNGN